MRTSLTYIIFFLCTSAYSQEFELKEHSPHRASIYSAIIPGAGQMYNKKYWKIPIVYAALGSTVYFTYDNGQKYKQYRDAYLQRQEGEKDEYDGIYNDSQLITIMGHYERNKELSMIMTVAVYILNIVDASVDAHLFDFDVSEELTMNTTPKLIQTQNGYQPTLCLQMNF